MCANVQIFTECTKNYDEKMTKLQGELKDLLAQEQKSKQELLEVMKNLGYSIEI